MCEKSISHWADYSTVKPEMRVNRFSRDKWSEKNIIFLKQNERYKNKCFNNKSGQWGTYTLSTILLVTIKTLVLSYH